MSRLFEGVCPQTRTDEFVYGAQTNLPTPLGVELERLGHVALGLRGKKRTGARQNGEEIRHIAKSRLNLSLSLSLSLSLRPETVP
jgi:hypothetical protein